MTTAWDALNEDFAPHKIGNRTDSTAMLAWYLRNVERLDDEYISDYICDGNGDKGIDALVVNDSESEITIYQAKRMDSPSKTQGDKDLKHFVGAAQYFASEETVRGLLESKPRDELRRLLLRNDVQSKVAQGYRVKRLVYVTNSLLDSSGDGYVDAMVTQEPSLDVWDQTRLAAVAERVRREGMRPERVTLRATTAPIIDDLGGKAKLAVALIPAKELLNLPGIADMTLFSRNVRLSAGNTRINRELAETVDNAAEHDIFPAAHNGITMLTLGLAARGRTIKLNSVSVVNGCQSMLALHKAEKSLSDSLKLLVKIVELPSAGSNLSDTITYRANNQNAVNMRDQRSTDTTQLDLKRQVTKTFSGTFAYVIKTGELTTNLEVLDNTLAAQLIVAVLRQRPWAAVRKVRLFDEDYHEVFKQDITAYSLRFLFLLNAAVEAARDDLKGELRSSFASVKFTLASLTTDLLRLSAHGIGLINDPARWIPGREDAVRDKLISLTREVVTHLNAYVDDQQKLAGEQGLDFDAKTVFKSQQGVSPLQTRVTMLGRWMGDRDEEYLFNIAPV
ncbi:AIPR family protein [Curtobacterium sp. MCBD17_032]|uniref:AIPR family protein n=1 Tax=Curtobacterium sp. MCBD17_032 TaxID=2175659 RepID=UPI0015E8E582|nr:AIPR family protein [Curtobacterium sp. MCBD17_032]